MVPRKNEFEGPPPLPVEPGAQLFLEDEVNELPQPEFVDDQIDIPSSELAVERAGVINLIEETRKRREAAEASQAADKERGKEITDAVIRQRFEATADFLAPISETITPREHDSLVEHVVVELKNIEQEQGGREYVRTEDVLYRESLLARKEELTFVKAEQGYAGAREQVRSTTADERRTLFKKVYDSGAELLKRFETARVTAQTVLEQKTYEKFVQPIVTILESRILETDAKVTELSRSASNMYRQSEGGVRRAFNKLRGIFGLRAPEVAIQSVPLARMPEFKVDIPSDAPRQVDRSTIVTTPPVEAAPKIEKPAEAPVVAPEPIRFVPEVKVTRTTAADFVQAQEDLESKYAAKAVERPVNPEAAKADRFREELKAAFKNLQAGRKGEKISAGEAYDRLKPMLEKAIETSGVSKEVADKILMRTFKAEKKNAGSRIILSMFLRRDRGQDIDVLDEEKEKRRRPRAAAPVAQPEKTA